MNWKRLAFLAASSVLFASCALTSRERATLQAHAVPPGLYTRMTHGDWLSPGDVVVLSQRGVPSALIIRYMDLNDCVYRLQKTDVARLRTAGVPHDVIAYMLSTGYHRPGSRVVYGVGYGYPYGWGYPGYWDDPFWYGGWGWQWDGGWGHDHWDHGDHGDWGHGGGWGHDGGHHH